MRFVVLFVVLCFAATASADIECGGKDNKKCGLNHFCCGDKSMKRPSPDEQGTAPEGLSRSHCVDHDTPPAKNAAALRDYKKLICPDKEFRQFNGDQNNQGSGVVRKRPKNRQRSITPLVAGISWGMKDDPHYCTLGAVLCPKSGDTSKRYFLSNFHCYLYDGLGIVNPAGPTEIAIQPSASPQDQVDNPKTKKPAPIGHLVFGERVWVDAIGYRDISVFEIDASVPVKARVMVEDNPDRMKQQTKKVLGLKTFAEVEALKKAHADLKFCISGRTGGWGCYPVGEVKSDDEGQVIRMSKDGGSESINPHFIWGGNSGSVFWYKDPNEDGYWAVGLFSGTQSLDPMDAVLAAIKEHSKDQRLDLTVCTHDVMPKNPAYKKGKKKLF